MEGSNYCKVRIAVALEGKGCERKLWGGRFWGDGSYLDDDYTLWLMMTHEAVHVHCLHFSV